MLSFSDPAGEAAFPSILPIWGKLRGGRGNDIELSKRITTPESRKYELN